MAPARVLVVDDSPTMRGLITAVLRSDPEVSVVGQAGDALEAREAIKQLNPDVVTLDASDWAGAIPLPPGSEPLAEFASDTECHTVVAIVSARLRLCVHKVQGLTVPTLTIPCDPGCALRLAAAARFQRVTQSERGNIDRSAVPTAYQRSRWVRFLALHDALEAGASSRDLAFGIVFPNHRALKGAEWKGSGERRHVLRLTAAARRLVTSGYRSLLQHR